MYRTGDLAVRDDRGALVFLGRTDRQLKIRGHRVEPGEIEVVARSTGGVRNAVAVACGEGADRGLVLYVLSETGIAIDVTQVRQRLAAELPSYMQPAHVHQLDSMPTTATGKTDRDALVRLADQLVAERRSAQDTEAEDYADELERELAAVWTVVLGVTGIPRSEPVFEHGAHSLNIFTALAQIEDRFGVAVPMVDFFRSPTIAALAGLVRAGRT
jgi:acyl carrier protein